MKNRKIKIILLCFIALIAFICCEDKKEAPVISYGLKPIDIKPSGFFWMLRTWKKGTLLTMDRKARFSEISFTGKNRMKITPLIEFPRQGIDSGLDAAPEAGICAAQSGALFYIADITAKKTKSHYEQLSWRWDYGLPMILDPTKGIVVLPYFSREYDNITEMPYYYVFYDLKNDEFLYKSPENGETIMLLCSFTPELVLAKNEAIKNEYEYVMYNWKTKEIIRNELTKELNAQNIYTYLDPNLNINLKERYMFADIHMPKKSHDKKIKITWDENYENVKVIPLDYLIPKDKWFYDFYLSPDGEWATNFANGYGGGLYEESMSMRVFFHLDSRYPNGISMPIFVDEYYESPREKGAFFEHPEYGMCYAEEIYLEEKGKEKHYLRLYKMSEVLAEINRQLSEETQNVTSGEK